MCGGRGTAKVLSIYIFQIVFSCALPGGSHSLEAASDLWIVGGARQAGEAFGGVVSSSHSEECKPHSSSSQSINWEPAERARGMESCAWRWNHVGSFPAGNPTLGVVPVGLGQKIPGASWGSRDSATRQELVLEPEGSGFGGRSRTENNRTMCLCIVLFMCQNVHSLFLLLFGWLVVETRSCYIVHPGLEFTM